MTRRVLFSALRIALAVFLVFFVIWWSELECREKIHLERAALGCGDQFTR